MRAASRARDSASCSWPAGRRPARNEASARCSPWLSRAGDAGPWLITFDPSPSPRGVLQTPTCEAILPRGPAPVQLRERELRLLTGSLFDELFDAPDRPRGPAAALTATLGRLGSERLRGAGERRDAIFVQQGITFDASGPDGGPTRDRPFPLDLIPRLLPAAEWRTIKRGLAQRVRALNLFVDDVYHEREIVREGIVPWQLVVTRPAFARAAHRIRPPGGVWCHVSGCDLVRDADGRWKVLEDNVRTPSGISYVLENRIAMSRLLPELFAGYDVRPVSHYPALLLEAL